MNDDFNMFKGNNALKEMALPHKWSQRVFETARAQEEMPNFLIPQSKICASWSLQWKLVATVSSHGVSQNPTLQGGPIAENNIEEMHDELVLADPVEPFQLSALITDSTKALHE